MRYSLDYYHSMLAAITELLNKYRVLASSKNRNILTQLELRQGQVQELSKQGAGHTNFRHFNYLP